jgi:hypothetical protein
VAILSKSSPAALAFRTLCKTHIAVGAAGLAVQLVPLGNPQEMQYTDDVGLDAGFMACRSCLDHVSSRELETLILGCSKYCSLFRVASSASTSPR